MQAMRFNTAHRAMADVTSLLILVLTQLEGGGTVLDDVIRRARTDNVRVEATGAPNAERRRLKTAGYSWDAGQRVWWTEVPPGLADIEAAWLTEVILTSRCKPNVYRITWH